MSYWSLDKKSCLQYCRHFLADNGVFHVERCMSVMQSGTQMVKLKSGTKGLVRLFYLDEHRTCIRWRPSRKSEKAKIVIDSIYKVSEGRQSEIFHRHAEGSFDPSCCFTIYHGNHLETLDLITSNPEEARTWITGLKYLMAGISDEDSLAKRQRTHDHWVKQTFQEADKNGDGLLNIEEIHQLMHKLNVSLPRRKVRQMFQEADTDENQGTLNFEEFSVFYKMMSLRRDLYLLLLSYSDKKDHLTAEELAQFLRVEQKMNNVTPEYCLDIIQKFEVSEENKKQSVLGIEGFTNFMRSPACEVSNPLHREVHQDMGQPLCHYFIASSHNTYLSGDQLLSQSRAEMYARVLQAGCRCIEVDCWDGPDGEPVVHHGYTLTSKILFRDVAETINKYAFIKNEFPVILSIENHCSIQQQKKIAQYLKEIFGDKLDLSSVNTGDPRQLPSPQDLKGKILVKGKKLPCSLGADAEEGEVSEDDSADEIEDDCKLKSCFSNGATQHQVESFIRTKLESLMKESQIRDKEDPDSFTVRALLKATHQSFNVNPKQNLDTKEGGKKSHGRSLMGNFGKHKKAAKAAARAQSTSDDEDGQQHPPGKELWQPHSRLAHRRKTVKLCRALSDLVVYTNSVAGQDIVDDGSPGTVLSFSESRAHQAVQQKAEQFMLYNQRQLTRVYPSAYRIDSSNFNPVPYWNVGCQLVALNYQSEGRVMQLNEAKFRVNGNCGYVLKPQQMCKGTFNPYSADPLPASPKKQLVLKIISGQQLPKPPDSMLGDRGEIIDPFVEVEIIGLPVDCCKDQTRVVDDNGFNPVWEETLTFTIHMPEIALVRFLVWDHDPIGRDFVGQRTVAFSSLVPGYRHVYLEGLTEASIFVHIIINETYGKSKQLVGLRGLFSKGPKAGTAEASGLHVRKRSIGERILRRTASAPAKGRKKSKMGFLEAAEMKDSTSEPAELQDKEGVVWRPNRSLQVRPASMPVDRFLMVELPCPAEDTAQEAKGEEDTSANSDDNTNEKEMSLKEVVFPWSEQKANASNLASQFKKENDQRDSTADSLVPPPQEHLVFAGGVSQANHLMDYQENNLSDGTVSLMQDSDSELPTEQSHHKNCADSKKEDDTKGSKEGKITVMGTSLSQKEEVENHKYDTKKSTATPLSLSSAVCSEGPDCHSAVALQDSDISHLIDEVSLSTESELDSTVSALIGQLDGTDNQTPLLPVSSPHGSNSQTPRVGAALPNVFAAHLSSPCRHNFTPIKSNKSPLFSTLDTATFCSPEDAEYATYTTIHEASPASECRSHRELVCRKRLNSLENNLPGSSCSSSLSLLNANPKRNCGTKSGPSWEAPESASSFGSNSLIFEEGLGLPVPGEHSDSSSLLEVDGDCQDLLVTACEYKRGDMNQLASPLSLRQKQDLGHGGDRTSASSFTAGLCAAVTSRSSSTAGLCAAVTSGSSSTAGLGAAVTSGSSSTAGLCAAVTSGSSSTAGLCAAVTSGSSSTAGLCAVSTSRSSSTAGLCAVSTSGSSSTAGLCAAVTSRSSSTAGLGAAVTSGSSSTAGLCAAVTSGSSSTAGLCAAVTSGSSSTAGLCAVSTSGSSSTAGLGAAVTSGSSSTAGLCAAARHCSENFRAAGSQLRFPTCENSGFFREQHWEKHRDAVRAPQLSPACLVLPGALPFPPHPAIQHSSPCKSKSLGDLTSEDISCNFESKYQYISRSFISSGLRDTKAAAMRGVRPHSTDALTEQLRKLLALEQEDSREPLWPRQTDEDCPRALVRKLSSRSQSRVRNIASRARERQEAAGKQRPGEGSAVPGVVLRNKAAGPRDAANRHSTGSYIGRYLHGCPAERRGVPEGACSALQHGCGDRLCPHGPGLQLPPGAQDQPEIYFLLRL